METEVEARMDCGCVIRYHSSNNRYVLEGNEKFKLLRFQEHKVCDKHRKELESPPVIR
jgi:hypothetical protein